MREIYGRAQETDINLAVFQRFILQRGKNIATFDFHGRKVLAMFENDFADGASQPEATPMRTTPDSPFCAWRAACAA